MRIAQGAGLKEEEAERAINQNAKLLLNEIL
jgi:hypothetical protein